MKKLYRFARLTIAIMAAAISIFVGLAGVVRPAEAQTAGYPDATNTGVPSGTSLTPSGSITVSTNGATIDALDVTGCITVTGNNVTIRRTRVRCAGSSGIYTGDSNTGALIEDTEVACLIDGCTAITRRNYTARRVNVHGGMHVTWAEGNVTIEDSYLHDPIPYDPVTDPHTSSIQLPSGTSNVTIRHNRIYGQYLNQSNFGTTALTMGGGTSNITVDNNILAGGGYTLYCNQGGKGTNDSYINNRFSRVFVATVGGFGPWSDCADENISGNVYHETGQLLPGQTQLVAPAAPTNARIIR
jgi:hypothetical protein